MELVERDEQLEALAGLLQEARGSAGRLVLLGGEAGAGKTSLARAFVATLPDRVRVLWGSCDPLSTPRPLAPLRDMPALAPLLERSIAGHELLGELLAELGVAGVMVIEDAHWIDEATLDALLFVGRRVERTRTLVLVTYRDDELGQDRALQLLLGDLATAPGCARMRVPPLTPAGVAALAAGSDVAADRLHRVTGGNAFYVTEVLAAPARTVPTTVSDAVLARVSRLSPGARGLLELVSLAPGGLEPEIARRLVPQANEALDESARSGVLVASAEVATFRNELARLAVEEAVPATTRHVLHCRLVEELEASPGIDAARLSHHTDAAGDGTRVLRYAPLAARQAATRGAHREAAAQYARALRFARRLDPDQRADLYEARSYECYLTGELEQAIDAQESTVRCRRMLGDDRRTGDALRQLSRLLRFVGRIERAEAVGQDALELLRSGRPSHELALAYNNLAHIRATADDAEGTRTWATSGLELAETLDDVEGRAYALTNLGAADFMAGGADGIGRLEQGLALALEAGLEEVAGRAHVNLVWRPLQQRDYALARRHLDAGLDYCTDHGLDLWRLFLVACQARLELDQGNWDDAEELAGACIRDRRSWPVPRVFALAVLGSVRARRGNRDAWASLEEAFILAAPTGELQQIAPTAAARAEAAWLEGRPDVIGEMTDDALALAVSRHAPWVVGELACWRRRAGIDEEIPRGTADAYALQLAGDNERAAARWSELGCPYEAALALADANRPEAIRRSLDELQRLGATPAVAIVAKRLRARGVRGLPRGPRASTRANPARLTARQLEVLALLEEGLSNTGIAERLFITEKTAAHHVSAILRKLGAGSRGEAVAAARKLGIDSPQT